VADDNLVLPTCFFLCCKLGEQPNRDIRGISAADDRSYELNFDLSLDSSELHPHYCTLFPVSCGQQSSVPNSFKLVPKSLEQ
jgi:hypothetical protein